MNGAYAFIVLERREENPVMQWLKHLREVQILRGVKSVPWLADTSNGCAASLLDLPQNTCFLCFLCQNFPAQLLRSQLHMLCLFREHVQ